MDEGALDRMAAGFCGQLKNFITSLHTNTAQLKASMSRKPPAYCDLSSFLLDFNDRVAEDGAQMDLLEEMTVENVSFEELLAHCMELYKQNESSIASLETQLEQFGYTKGESGAGGEEMQPLDLSFVEGLKQRVRAKESSPRGPAEIREDVQTTPTLDLLSSNSSGSSYAQFETIRSSASRARFQSSLPSYQSPLPSALSQSKVDSDDLLQLGDSLSLEELGISASSLAQLAGVDASFPQKIDFPNDQKQPVASADERCSDDMDESCDLSPPDSPTHEGSEQSLGTKSHSSLPLLGQVTSAEYSQVQSWLRHRVSFEDLNKIIVEINDAFHVQQSETAGNGSFDGKSVELEEAFLLGLGPKMKSGLLILVQMDRLVVACHDSRTYYRPSELAKFR